VAASLISLTLSAAAPAAPPAEYVPDIQAPFPRLRFADGSTSLNDRCPVRKSKLNRKLAPVFINGRPIGFC
jgi:hypothetical protein